MSMNFLKNNNKKEQVVFIASKIDLKGSDKQQS